MPRISFILSIDSNFLMGVDGKLAYTCATDMGRFRNLTTNCGVVVMGYTTWVKLPYKKPLFGRQNVVLTHRAIPPEPGVVFVSNLEDYLSECDKERIYCIGGAACFRSISQRYKSVIDHVSLTVYDASETLNDNEIGTYFENGILEDMSLIEHSSQSDNIIDWRGNLHTTKVHYKTYVMRPNIYADESNYLETLRELAVMPERETRNARVHSKFGHRFVFDCRGGRVPLLSSKRMPWKTVVRELLWFVRGNTNNRLLQAEGVHIWDANSSRSFLDAHGLARYSEGDCGPIYGHQWRFAGAPYVNCTHDYTGQGFDQLNECERLLREDPYSRRILMSSWNVPSLNDMALPPCHVLCQFYVEADGLLSLQLYQRSGDAFLGVPFNMFSYAVLLHMMAQRVGREAGRFIHIVGDLHVYATHIPSVHKQLRASFDEWPRLKITPKNKWSDYLADDFCVEEYTPRERIAAPMVA